MYGNGVLELFNDNAENGVLIDRDCHFVGGLCKVIEDGAAYCAEFGAFLAGGHVVGLMHFIEEVEGEDEVNRDLGQISIGEGADHVHSVVPEFLVLGGDGFGDVCHEFVEAEDGPIDGHVIVFHHFCEILDGVGQILIAKVFVVDDGGDDGDHLVDLG